MVDFRQQFLEFALEKQVLKFGEFVTKAGRVSPYFFNAGLFDDGESLMTLARFYATSILASGVEFDLLFGPAYKGIVLASATSMALAEKGENVSFAYNRKEIKDHGEGGILVGAPLKGRVLIIDDVITAGTSIGESVKIIKNNGAVLAGVVIALDRLEKGQGMLSAVQEVIAQYQVPVISIASLDDLIYLLKIGTSFAGSLEKVSNYRLKYGV